MHNYTFPESCIAQTWPKKFRTPQKIVWQFSHLVASWMNYWISFHTPVLDILWVSYLAIPAAAVFIPLGIFFLSWYATLKMTTPLDIYLPYLTKSINYTINEGKFPAELKHPELIALFKKENPLKKENYRAVSLLSYLSKVFERII